VPFNCAPYKEIFGAHIDCDRGTIDLSLTRRPPQIAAENLPFAEKRQWSALAQGEYLPTECPNVYFDQTATVVAMVVAIPRTDHLFSPLGTSSLAGRLLTIFQFSKRRNSILQSRERGSGA
jgi:hypothetical protein